MKKLINTPDTVLADALAGIAAAHKQLSVDAAARIITRAGGPRTGKVALVSGGGSGHEPLHGGFVGTGMLDAACPGEVFTSPVPDQMLAAAKAVNGGAGVVFIVKNYTGDVMNFEMAADLAGDDGVEVATVLVDDDVAVKDSTWTAGRRGTGATVFVEKIAGALAEQGADLAQVAELGRRVNAPVTARPDRPLRAKRPRRSPLQCADSMIPLGDLRARLCVTLGLLNRGRLLLMTPLVGAGQ